MIYKIISLNNKDVLEHANMSKLGQWWIKPCPYVHQLTSPLSLWLLSRSTCAWSTDLREAPFWARYIYRYVQTVIFLTLLVHQWQLSVYINISDNIYAVSRDRYNISSCQASVWPKSVTTWWSQLYTGPVGSKATRGVVKGKWGSESMAEKTGGHIAKNQTKIIINKSIRQINKNKDKTNRQNEI